MQFEPIPQPQTPHHQTTNNEQHSLNRCGVYSTVRGTVFSAKLTMRVGFVEPIPQLQSSHHQTTNDEYNLDRCGVYGTMRGTMLIPHLRLRVGFVKPIPQPQTSHHQTANDAQYNLNRCRVYKGASLIIKTAPSPRGTIGP